MTRDDLLLAIADAPEDDDLRLVFADWLEEYGDELDHQHAELIRVQITLERLPPDDDRRAVLSAREETLLHRKYQICDRLQAPSCVHRALVWGFPERVGYDLNNSRKGRLSEDDLVQMAEAVTRLPIRTFAGDLLGCAVSSPSDRLSSPGHSGLEMLAGWPALAHFTSLEATSGITPYKDQGNYVPGLLALAASPHVSELRRLRLSGWQVDPEAMVAVASSARMPRLTDLDLGQHNFTNTVAALGALFGTPLAGRLERLACLWVDVPATTIRAWLDHAPLRHLSFGVPKERADGVGPLLDSSGLARLRELSITGEDHGFDVDEMPYDDDRRVIPYLTELLVLPQLAGLETLSLQGIALGDEGVRALVAGPAGRSLVTLNLSLCGLTGEGLQALRMLLTEGRLRRLSIGHNELTRADAEELASWPEFGRLHYLEVGYFTFMDEEGREALETSPHRHPWLKFT